MFAIRDRQIGEHGGRDGIRDIGLIESGLQPGTSTKRHSLRGSENRYANSVSLRWLCVAPYDGIEEG